jgi:hypothetical protein
MNNNKHLFSDMWGLPAKKKRNRNYNTVDYEWDIEITDNETENIEDHWFADKLKDLLWANPKSKEYEEHKSYHLNRHFVLVLVRDVGNDFDGLTCRSWAYPENNKMPTEFDDGTKVPKRFLIEYEKVWK